MLAAAEARTGAAHEPLYGECLVRVLRRLLLVLKRPDPYTTPRHH